MGYNNKQHNNWKGWLRDMESVRTHDTGASHRDTDGVVPVQGRTVPQREPVEVVPQRVERTPGPYSRLLKLEEDERRRQYWIEQQEGGTV